MSFYEESSIVITPNAYKAGTLYAINPASGLADMDVTRATAATRVDESGLVNYADVIGDSILTGNNSTFDTGIGSWVTYNGGTLAHSTDKLEVTLTSGESGARINTNSLISGGQSGKTFKVRARIWKGTSTNSTIAIFIGGAQKFITISPTPTYFEAELTAANTSMLTIYRAGGGGGVGTYFIDDVTVKEVTRDNVPRIDYTGGGCPHILSEPQRTNLLQYSEAFNSWNTKENVTVAEDTSETTSPSGNNTASKITINSGSTPRRLFEVVSTGSGSDYTFTLYAKKGTTDYIRILCTSVLFDVNFDLTNGTKTVTTGIGSIESVGNDWYRIQGTGTSSLTNEVPQIQLSGSASVSDYLYIWGSQFEQGSYATSYIPTSGSTVTRNKDVFTRDGIGSLIGTEGVLFVEMAALSNDLTNRSISLNDGTSSNRLLLYFSSASNQIAVISTGFTGSINYAVSDETSFNKFAVRYKDNDVTLWVDGASRGTPITSATIPTFTALKFDSGAGASPFYGKVKQLQVYPTALSDAELTILTTP